MITAKQLIDLEKKYGGVHHVSCVHRSEYDDSLPIGYLMQGGDRMGLHGYADNYAKVLNAFSAFDSKVYVELGILSGVGLATICDLIPEDTDVIGLDINPSHFHQNKQSLKEKGAFSKVEPFVYSFDERSPKAADNLPWILGDRKINLFVDDALHDDISISSTFEIIVPYLADKFIYVIEDNNTAREQLRPRYPDMTFMADGWLTVIAR